jgi:tol-pal system protein YbgF
MRTLIFLVVITLYGNALAANNGLPPVEDHSKVAQSSANGQVQARLSQECQALLKQKLPEQIAQLQFSMRQLRSKLELAEQRIQRLSVKVKGVRREGSSVKTAVTVSSPSVMPSMAAYNEQGLYKRAFQAMQKHDYVLSTKLFTQLLEQYPQGQFSANALYWIGEIYLAQGNLVQAATSFDALLVRYPLSHKIPGAMLKKARILQQQGSHQEATALLQRLVKQYPSSSAAKLASNMLTASNQHQTQAI